MRIFNFDIVKTKKFGKKKQKMKISHADACAIIDGGEFDGDKSGKRK